MLCSLWGDLKQPIQLRNDYRLGQIKVFARGGDNHVTWRTTGAAEARAGRKENVVAE